MIKKLDILKSNTQLKYNVQMFITVENKTLKTFFSQIENKTSLK